jgi:hypothetical protein
METTCNSQSVETHWKKKKYELNNLCPGIHILFSTTTTDVWLAVTVKTKERQHHLEEQDLPKPYGFA